MRPISWSRGLLQRTVRSLVAASILAAGFIGFEAHAAGFTYHIVQPASSASGSKERNFDYYVPSTYVPGLPSPLYVVLHGCRISDRTMTDMLGMETFAERDRAIILYPFQNNDASSNDNDGRNPNCWGYWYDVNTHRDQGEVGDIKRMVDYMKRNFTVDENRVHITGISSGGAMTTIAQVAYPDVFASSAIIEGVGYGETAATYTGTTDCAVVINNNLGSVLPTSTTISKMRSEMQKSVLRQPPVLVMHNKKDCTVPIKVGQAIIDAFLGLRAADGKGISSTPTYSVNGAVDGMPYTWSKYGNDGYGNSLVEAVILDVTEQQVLNAGIQVLTTDPWDASGSSNNAVKEDTKRGHWWPGAAKRAPWILNKGINANQVAADFFRAHPMNGGGSQTTTTTTSTSSTTTTSKASTTSTSTTSTSKATTSSTQATTSTTKATTSTTKATTTTTAKATSSTKGTTTTTSATTSSTKATTSTTKATTSTTRATSTTTTTTTTSTVGASSCYSASNAAHVLAGRAYNFWGMAYAFGSNQFMGMASTKTTTSLKKAAPFYYVIGSCS